MLNKKTTDESPDALDDFNTIDDIVLNYNKDVNATKNKSHKGSKKSTAPKSNKKSSTPKSETKSELVKIPSFLADFIMDENNVAPMDEDKIDRSISYSSDNEQPLVEDNQDKEPLYDGGAPYEDSKEPLYDDGEPYSDGAPYNDDGAPYDEESDDGEPYDEDDEEGDYEDDEDDEESDYDEDYYDDFDDENSEFSIKEDIFNVNKIITKAISLNASDIYFKSNWYVTYRVNGKLVVDRDLPRLTPDVTMRIEQDITTSVAHETFLEKLELDTSYLVREGDSAGRRLRVNAIRSFQDVEIFMRIINNKIPQPDELGIGEDLLEWTTLNRGLVLMNGPTGTGKSTTLASLIQEIYYNRSVHIITLEKPIEYVYDLSLDASGVVTQREIGIDARNYLTALDSAMRDDPDVILVGETRNASEFDALIYAASTGHLGLSTTHASSASGTISRIKGMYSDQYRQREILSDLSTSLKGLASQVLCVPTDGVGRFAVREVLRVDETISDMVRTGDDKGILKVQFNNKSTLEHELVRVVETGKCTKQEALSKAPDTRLFLELWEDRDKFII